MKHLLVAMLTLLLVGGCAAPAAPPATPAATPVAFEVLLPPNAIRALDHPPTVSAAEAASLIGPYDEVMGVAAGGEARAYPLGMMSRHEVANDTLGGQPIGVTFCPLCNSGVAFSRRVGDGSGAERELTFALSGKFLDGALVMMDQETGSLWAQSRLLAVEGPMAGTGLELLTSSQMPWDEWVAAHPDTTLVVEGSERAQGAFQIPTVPVAGSEPKPPTGSGYVVGVASDAAALAVPLEVVEAAGVINGEREGLAPFALVSLGEPGLVAAWQREYKGQSLTFVGQGELLKDQETGSTWDPHTGKAEAGPLAGAQLEAAPALLTHWLGWLDLHPTTTVLEG